MGKIKQGILGGFKGKVGTVIGASWNGIAYMKGLPQSQKDPKTAAQMAQRNYFREIQGLAGQLTTEQLASLYPSVTSGRTRRNMLVHQLAAAAAIVDDVKTVDLSQIEGIGSGEHIDSPMLESVVTLTNDVKDFYAEPAAAEQIGKPAEANFIVVAYNLTQKKIGIFNTEETDPSMGVSVPVGSWAEVGDAVRFYLTYATKGENVYLRGFGSFIIKTRPEKKGRNISKA